jgi:hypothetical protein
MMRGDMTRRSKPTKKQAARHHSANASFASMGCWANDNEETVWKSRSAIDESRVKANAGAERKAREKCENFSSST